MLDSILNSTPEVSFSSCHHQLSLSLSQSVGARRETFFLTLLENRSRLNMRYKSLGRVPSKPITNI